MLLVATEDELSEAVVCRLVIEAGEAKQAFGPFARTAMAIFAEASISFAKRRGERRSSFSPTWMRRPVRLR